MLAATTPAVLILGANGALAPLAPDRAPTIRSESGAGTALVPTGPPAPIPALEAPTPREGGRFNPRHASPREIAQRSLEFYAEGFLDWDDHAQLAFQPELHPDYDRTIGALTGTKAEPDRPRDFVADWEQRLLFELRYNPENAEAVARARRIVRALRRAAEEESDMSV